MTLKCELPGKTLAAAIRAAAAACPRGNTLPVLANLLICGRGGALEISGTDMDQSTTVTADGIAAEGALTAPAATLASIAQRCDEDVPVTLEERDAQLHIKRGRATWRMPILPADEFPDTVTRPIEGVLWQPPAAALCGHLKALAGAIDPDNPRTYLQGIYFDLGGPEPHLVATETHKLGAVAIDGLAPPPDAAPFILPYDAVRVAAEFDDADGLVDFTLSHNAVTIGATRAAGTAGLRYRYWTKLIDGQYPDWRAVFPARDALPRTVRAEAAGLAAALGNIGAVEGDLVQMGKVKARVTSVRLDFAADGITATVANSAGEGATDNALAILEEGPAGGVVVNGAYLDWAVKSLPGAGELILKSGEAAAMVIRHAEDTAGADRRLVATMRG